MESKKRRRLRSWLARIMAEMAAIIIMMFLNDICLHILGTVIILIITFSLIRDIYFNNKEKFDEDSLYLMLTYISPILFLILISIVASCIKESQEYLKNYTEYAIMIMSSLFLYFGFVYFFRCLKVIKEIRGDKHLFVVETIKSTLEYFLFFLAAGLAIISFSDEQGYMFLTYQLSNVFVNSILLFIDMFVYVRSKIDEFDKQEEEKVDEEKKEKLHEQKYEMDKKELQTIKKEIEMMKNKINRKTAKIEYKIIHYKNK